MNEPNGTLDALLWNSISAEAISSHPQEQPDRNLVIGGASWNAYDQLQYLALPER